MKVTWLADVLRDAGLKVEERSKWKDRGRGEMGTVKGVICHHTAGPLMGNVPSLRLIEKGRPDLPGPLSQLVLGRDGTFFVVAAGKCNHAGRGEWQGVVNGNSEMIGIEAENAGTGKDIWPVAQMDAYVRGVAAILKHIGADPIMAVGHKEWALPRGRKVDPTFDMIEFRENVEKVMEDKASTQVSTVDPKRSMLRKGDTGKSVGELQELLGIEADEIFGPQTEKAVKKFQEAHGLVADGLVGPKTWNKLEEK